MVFLTIFNTSDGVGNSGSAPRFSAYVTNHIIAANAAVSVTIPVDEAGRKARYAVFSRFGGDYAVRIDGTAAFPSTDIINGAGSVINPKSREVSQDTTSISIAAGAFATRISIEWYI